MAAIEVEARRRNAALAAAKRVGKGDRVGLGTGRTAAMMVEELAARAKAEKLELLCVATSVKTEELARSLGLNVIAPDEAPPLDIAIDGADEVDPELDLIKGLGGALLRERLVERTAKSLVIMVDDEKLVPTLGQGKVPVEIVPFGARRTMKDLQALGGRAELRIGENRKPFLTDGGHWIVDLTFPEGKLPHRKTDLASSIKALPGVVDHGLFLGMATEVVIGKVDGTVETRRRGR